MRRDVRSYERYSEARSLEFACAVQGRQDGESTTLRSNGRIAIGMPAPERRIDKATARAITSTVGIRDISERTSEAEIQKHSDGAQERDAA